ncbi:hypothetical protein PRIPAC_94840 [Pristionchus pacificus]|uniref:Uncharacterized protein n=1 Tax=Pristionchus pacificus TaxID=54126 RepID=A0A2A6CI70_PRIPA|nr:hypothetical protein PRIPAC_94840 [Pristionchus pacificus]|eukprot:PDM77790.1 hypothetical protein PRIPAC_34657 [Pristionchus pacificus]
MSAGYLSIFLVLSILVAPSRPVHVLTAEEERCATFALHKMAVEPDLVFKKRLATALKIVSNIHNEKQ